MIAVAIANPLDDKKTLAAQPTSKLDSNKPPLTSDPKAQAPTQQKAPLHKRDTPKTTDQKTNAAPVTNNQKAQSVPNPASSAVKPSNSRQTRDTQKAQDSYKPQPSGVPQKSSAPAPTNTDSKTSNNRQVRETPKAQVNDQKAPVNNQKTPVTNNQKNSAPTSTNVNQKTPSNNRPARDTPKAQVNDQKVNAQKPAVTPQKNTAPVAATPQKPQQNSRNKRDTVKQTNQQAPVTWNKDDKTKSSPPTAQKPSTLNADRKTRETPKNTQTDNKAKTSNPTQPEVAKVPLTSTNSQRNRRDAPNPAEQSKLVPSGSISGNVQNPALQARKDPIPTTSPLNHKRDTQGSNIRRPVPVDQVLKQKTTDDKPAAAAPVADK